MHTFVFKNWQEVGSSSRCRGRRGEREGEGGRYAVYVCFYAAYLTINANMHMTLQYIVSLQKSSVSSTTVC